ncbi:MAG: type I secretion system permease/ATPase [Pseudomonadota bacterium]
MQQTAPTILNSALRQSRVGLVGTAVFSMFINLLMLAGPIYMLQVYDRVLPSKSIETLVALSLLLIGLFIISGCLELVRVRLLSRAGSRLEARVAPAVFDASVRKRIASTNDDGADPLADLSSIRDFLAGNGLPAFFDLPWVPIYLVILALLHPVLGLLGSGGAVFLFGLAWINNQLTQAPTAKYAETINLGHVLAKAGQSNAEVLRAMGMAHSVRRLWLSIHRKADAFKTKATDRSGAFSVVSKTSRLALQSAALGIGAALVVADQLSAGAMIAGTIILGRGLAPIDQSIAHWRGLIAAKASFARLELLLSAYPEAAVKLSQGRVSKSVSVERVYAGPPGAQKAIVSGIDFSLRAGDALAILGPSASGKSTLAKLLAGIWLPQSGKVRLDAAALDQFNNEELGNQIGYLPQEVELFEGTLAQNIARFQTDATDMEIIAAAESAGVHEMILQLPDGYETNIGKAGRRLSGGQRQRIGLARALFREPFLVILDEPNANLDANGDMALMGAISSIKTRGGVVIVITHRPGFVDGVDFALVLDGGRQRTFGPVADVLAPTSKPSAAAVSNVMPLAKLVT